MTKPLKTFCYIILVTFFASCATVQQQQQPESAIYGATSVQSWFDGAGAFYCATHDGAWYILGQPKGGTPVRATVLSIADPQNMSVLNEIKLGHTHPNGFAINHRGEFVTGEGNSVQVFGATGEALYTIHVSMEDARLNSAVACDAQDRIYAATLGGLELYTRDGKYLQKVSVEGLPQSVAIAPDQTVWCISDEKGAGHLTHLGAFPGCAVLAEYSRTHPIRGIAATDAQNYSDWRELAVTDRAVMMTCGTGGDKGQCVYVLSTDGGALLNKLMGPGNPPAGLLNAHGLAASADTLIYLDYDPKDMSQWLNRWTKVDAPMGNRAGM